MMMAVHERQIQIFLCQCPGNINPLRWRLAVILPDSAGLCICFLTLSGNDVCWVTSLLQGLSPHISSLKWQYYNDFLLATYCTCPRMWYDMGNGFHGSNSYHSFVWQHLFCLCFHRCDEKTTEHVFVWQLGKYCMRKPCFHRTIMASLHFLV